MRRQQRFSNRTVEKGTYEKAKQLERRIPKDKVCWHQRTGKQIKRALSKIKF